MNNQTFLSISGKFPRGTITKQLSLCELLVLVKGFMKLIKHTDNNILGFGTFQVKWFDWKDYLNLEA